MRGHTPSSQALFKTKEGQEHAQQGRVAGKKNKKVLRVDVPGGHGPSHSESGKLMSQKQVNQRMMRAPLRTEAAIDQIFDFMLRIISHADAVLTKVERENRVPDEEEMRLVSEGRMISLKFMDKTVPDLVERDSQNTSPVTINIGAPLSRLRQSVVEIPALEEQPNGDTDNQLQPNSVSDQDSRQPSENQSGVRSNWEREN